MSGTEIDVAARPQQLAPVASETSRKYARRSRAKATVSAYEGCFKHFVAWCQARGFSPLPAVPATVCEYLAEMAEGMTEPDRFGTPRVVRRSVSTMHQYKCAISSAHRIAAYDGADVADPTKHPTVALTWEGIRRELGAPARAKHAITPQELAKMVAELGHDLPGVRDQAMLVLGLCGAFRRSELCGLEVKHVTFQPEGLRILLPRSKTDQHGRGRVVAVMAHPGSELCPVRCLRAWLDAAGITTGPVFRGVTRWGVLRPAAITPKGYVDRLKQAAARAGLDPRQVAGHSLRAGFVTSAIAGGAQPLSVMDVTGHKNFETLRRYIREASLWRDNAGAYLKL